MSASKKHELLGGKYEIEDEIGKGSFATVFRGKVILSNPPSSQPIAIKSVIRSKLTSKLLENLESEIDILKGISHANIVELVDIVKTESHIYLMMFYCSMGDLSLYIPKRHASPEAQKRIQSLGLGKDYPNPPDGGLNEIVVRDFCGQLTDAVRFMHSKNIIHRDIKPQNLLLHPRPNLTTVTSNTKAPIPYLKVADFGFARWLPSQSLAETLCGSPLYMAPEILRYEKYDAKADLWSVGAVIYEICVGRAPFRASNHVELLRRIEKGDGSIKWPDDRKEEGTSYSKGEKVKVSEDLKLLVRGLLKRNPVERMSFESYFKLANDVRPRGLEEEREKDKIAKEKEKENQLRKTAQDFQQGAFVVPSHMRTVSNSSFTNVTTQQQTVLNSPLSTSPKVVERARQTSVDNGYGAGNKLPKPSSSPSSSPSPLNPRHSPQPSTSSSPHAAAFIARPPTAPSPPPSSLVRVRDYALTHTSTRSSTPQPASRMSSSPSSSIPPASVPSPDDSILLGKEYVVVEKQNVEINALADELAYGPKTIGRRNSRGFLNRQPSASTSSHPPINYPPTPAGGAYEAPFAIPNRLSGTSTSPSPLAYGSSPRTSSPRDAIGNALFRPGSFDRHSTSPLGIVGGPSAAIVKVWNKASFRLFGGNIGDGIFFSSKKRKGYRRAGPSRLVGDGTNTNLDGDPAELKVIDELEDLAKKALVVAHFADEKLFAILPPTPSVETYNALPNTHDRRRSSSSLDRDIGASGNMEFAAAEGLILYICALGFLQKGIEKAKLFWMGRTGQQLPSTDFNEAVQWLRARFNECFDKAEYVKARAQDVMPESVLNAEKLLYDKALEISRSAAVRELSGENASESEADYETALWMLHACRDKSFHGVSTTGGETEDEEVEDTATLDKFIGSIQARLSALRKRIEKSKVVSS